MIKILIIEDDINLCNGIEIALTKNNFEIHKSYSIKQAKEKIAENSFELIILDINLPDGNGISFLKKLKKEQDIPIILLTAKDLEQDVIDGFENGADDYITKPFSLGILRARVNAQLRNQKNQNIFIQNNFKFDFVKMEYFVSENKVEFSKTEQKLLEILCKNKGIILKREVLIEKIWTSELEFVEENALSVAIKRLRIKLKDEKCIKTIYGIGYSWVK